HQFVGNRDVGRLPGERHPAKRPASLTKQWTYIFRHETGKVICVLYSVLESESPNVVAIVESHRPHFLQSQHAFDVLCDCIQRALLVALRIDLARFTCGYEVLSVRDTSVTSAVRAE